MYTHEIEIRVRYGETDQMGYVYYGNYAQYFEVARVEMLRSLGINYRDLEESGILLPVISLSIRYIKPARYDDLLKIKTTIHEMPTARISFTYECLGPEGDLLTKAETSLVFQDKQTGKPRRTPPELLAALAPYFSSDAER